MSQDQPIREKYAVKVDVTLKDIAEVVGKSVAAVSRALNDYDDISDETRAYVKQVAKEMGYTPNLMAQRLKKRTTDTLGFILPELSPRVSDPYFSELLSGITNEAARHGYDLLVSTCMPGPNEAQTYSRLISSRRVDGIVVARPRWIDDRIDLLLDNQFPFVVVGSANVPEQVPTVSEDATVGARSVVDHIIEQGHEKIALISAPSDLIFATDFLTGFRGAMATANLPVKDDYLTESELTQRDGYRVAQLFLSRPEAPTAIIATDDVVALGVMAAAQDQGLEVGNELAVTGYGDILLSEYSQPPLTTVHRPTYDLGQRACRTLIAQLNGEVIEENHVMLKPSLVIRQSSDLALWL